MPNLVVTCHPDGRVETLLKDKVLDTRMLGETRKIERVSEVLPTDDGQMFYIRWLKGPLSEATAPKWIDGARVVMFDAENGLYSNHGIYCHDDGTTIHYPSYEDAVAGEIAAVNSMRLAGYSFT